MKNEIMNTTDARVNEYKGGTRESFNALLQGEIGLSPLAVGTKFESDDLVNADGVKLLDFDLVEYTQDEGTAKEKQVRFYLWAVELSQEDGKGGFTTEKGYYQGGTILNKIAETIRRYNAYEDMQKFGINIKAEWGKTSSKNDILLITVI